MELLRLVKRSLWLRMVETEEHVDHKDVGDIKVVKDDVEEDAEKILEEKEALDTGLTD
jgi:hypothetical protein